MVGGWPGRKYDEQTRVWHMCDDNVVFFSSFFFDLKLQYIDYIRIQGVDIVRSEDINLNEIYIYIFYYFLLLFRLWDITKFHVIQEISENIVILRRKYIF